jgi:hypothetical protein
VGDPFSLDCRAFLKTLDRNKESIPNCSLTDFRQKRLKELSEISSASIYNQVYPLQKPDYAKDVTEASRKSFVVVLLTSQGAKTESRLLVELWRELASRFGNIKFCQIQADMCIEGYPEQHTPTILIYKDGDIKRQIVTLQSLRGENTRFEGMDCQSIAHRYSCGWSLWYDD